MTNKIVLEKFLIGKKVSGKSELTIERYEYIMIKFFKFCKLNYTEITPDKVKEYIYVSQSNGISNRTLDGERKIISSFYSWCKKYDYIKINPMDFVDIIKFKKGVRKPFSQVERERIKMACDNKRDLALVEFLYCTGARVSEVSRLNIEDIDFKTKEVLLLGKGEKERIVYLSNIAEQYLKEYLECREDKISALFISIKRPYQRLSKGAIEAVLKRLEAKSGVFNVHPHRYRRTIASDLALRGVQIQVISVLLGHESLDVTNGYIYSSSANIKGSSLNALNNF